MRTPVLRTVYLDADVDAELRMEAFDTRRSKDDLLVHYLRRGMAIARSQGLTAQPGDGRDSSPRKKPGLQRQTVTSTKPSVVAAMSVRHRPPSLR